MPDSYPAESRQQSVEECGLHLNARNRVFGNCRRLFGIHGIELKSVNGSGRRPRSNPPTNMTWVSLFAGQMPWMISLLRSQLCRLFRGVGFADESFGFRLSIKGAVDLPNGKHNSVRPRKSNLTLDEQFGEREP